jgi:capsid protein
MVVYRDASQTPVSMKGPAQTRVRSHFTTVLVLMKRLDLTARVSIVSASVKATTVTITNGTSVQQQSINHNENEINQTMTLTG